MMTYSSVIMKPLSVGLKQSSERVSINTIYYKSKTRTFILHLAILTLDTCLMISLDKSNNFPTPTAQGYEQQSLGGGKYRWSQVISYYYDSRFRYLNVTTLSMFWSRLNYMGMTWQLRMIRRRALNFLPLLMTFCCHINIS